MATIPWKRNYISPNVSNHQPSYPWADPWMQMSIQYFPTGWMQMPNPIFHSAWQQMPQSSFPQPIPLQSLAEPFSCHGLMPVESHRLMPVQSPPPTIRSVWSHNIQEEFEVICAAITNHSYVTMDTEFPSLTHPYSSDKPFYCRSPEERYAHLKENVDHLNITHFGLTLSDSTGNLPENCVWQFNFQPLYDQRKSRQVHARDALLKQRFDLKNDMPQAIQYSQFATLLLESGLVFSDSKIAWFVFGGSFDLGFLTKLLAGTQPLPETIDGFMELIKRIFGYRVFDLKNLMVFCGFFKGLGLEALAAKLNITREIEQPHEAGSDSLLSWRVFQKIKDMLKDNWEKQFSCVIAGLHIP